MVDLSVIIPTYRRKESLFKLLKRVNDQINIKLEVIVLDQNNSDFWEPEELIELNRLAKRVVQRVPNVSAARNIGAQLAVSKFLMFVDDDLLPDFDFCAKAINVFDNEVRSFCPTVFAYEGREAASGLYQLKHLSMAKPNVFKIEETLSACLFFEKSFYMRTGGFDPVLFDFAKSTEDQELFKRMAAREMKFYHASELTIFHDDKTAGGCDLRSEDYWLSRAKFMKGWAYRYAMHNKEVGKIGTLNFIQMVRSAFFNRGGLKEGFSYCKKQYKLLRSAIKETKLFVNTFTQKANVLRVNHFLTSERYK
jgi:glycosyltransferase involved in cell wall biosynthesis